MWLLSRLQAGHSGLLLPVRFRPRRLPGTSFLSASPKDTGWELGAGEAGCWRAGGTPADLHRPCRLGPRHAASPAPSFRARVTRELFVQRPPPPRTQLGPPLTQPGASSERGRRPGGRPVRLLSFRQLRVKHLRIRGRRGRRGGGGRPGGSGALSPSPPFARRPKGQGWAQTSLAEPSAWRRGPAKSLQVGGHTAQVSSLPPARQAAAA